MKSVAVHHRHRQGRTAGLTLFGSVLAAGCLSVSALVFPPPEVAQTDPEAGGEISDRLEIIFSQPMATDIAIEFSAGEWTSSWVELLGTRVQLICTATVAPPAGPLTVTLNPNGTGFKHAFSGVALATTVLSFTATGEGGGGGGLAVSVSPENGSDYCPSEGPIRFTFSKSMKPTSNLLIFPGNWTFEWVSDTVYEATTTDTLTPLIPISWTLNADGTGFESVDGEVLRPTFGTLTARLDCGSGGGGFVPAPDCPSPATPAAFPKALWVCNDPLGPLEAPGRLDFGVLFPQAGGGFALEAAYLGNAGSVPVLITLDNQGNTVRRLTTGQASTELLTGPEPDRVFATQRAAGSSELSVAAFNASTLQPLYAKVLTQDAPSHTWHTLPDGRLALVKYFSDRLEIVVLAANGAVEWARRYESADFAGGTGGVPGLGLTANLHVLASGFLLSVVNVQASTSGTSVSYSTTVVLARLSANGAVQWARRYSGLNSQGANVAVAQDGTMYLSVQEANVSNPLNPTFRTLVFKLDANGGVTWGRGLAGVQVGVAATFQNAGVQNAGVILAGLATTVSGTGFNADAVAIALNSLGAIQQQRKFDHGPADFLVLSAAGANDLVLMLSSRDEEAAGENNQTVFVGTADSQLGRVQWKQYHKAVGSAAVVPRSDPSGLVVSAFDAENHAVEAFLVDLQLNETASCELLVEGAPTESALSLSPTTETLQSASATVTATALTPQLSEGNLALLEIPLAEAALCEGGPGPTDCPAPGALAIRLSAADQITIEVAIAAGCNYFVQRTDSLAQPNWTDVQPLVAAGGTASFQISAPPGEGAGFFRVVARPVSAP